MATKVLTRCWQALLAGIFVYAASPSPVAADHLAGTTVRVGAGGGSWRESADKYVGSKLKEHGARVEWVTGSARDLVSKIIASRGRESPIDIVMSGSPEFYVDLVNEGLVIKLDYGKLPNAKAIPNWAKLEYAIIPLVADDGIAYNVEKFKENGIPAPQRFADLLHPKLQGRVAFPDIEHVEHWNAVVGLAYDAGGDETTMEKAVEMVNKIKPVYYFAASPDLGTKMGLGDIWAAPWHAGWVVRLKRAGLPLAHVNPKVGNTGKVGTLWPVYNYIAANARNKEGAHVYIDYLLDPEAQFEHSRTTGVVPVHPDALRRMMTDPENKDVLLLEPELVNNAFLIDWKKLDQRKWGQMWNRDIKR